MTGSEALIMMKRGLLMRRVTWLQDVYAVVKDNDIVMLRDTASKPQYTMAISDLLHDDWEVYL
jgi:hypothetical protein